MNETSENTKCLNHPWVRGKAPDANGCFYSGEPVYITDDSTYGPHMWLETEHVKVAVLWAYNKGLAEPICREAKFNPGVSYARTPKRIIARVYIKDKTGLLFRSSPRTPCLGLVTTLIYAKYAPEDESAEAHGVPQATALYIYRLGQEHGVWK
jgi:hypothetical protein